MRLLWLALSGVAMATILSLVVASIWGLGKALNLLGPVLWPLAIAGVIAYILDPVVDFLERRKVPRARAILCVFALAFVLVLGFLGSVVPQLVVETRKLVDNIPAYAEKVQKKAEDWINHPPSFLKGLLRRSSVAAEGGTNRVASVETTPAPGATNAVPAVQNREPQEPTIWTLALESGRLPSATAWLAKAIPEVGRWIFGQVLKVASWFSILAGIVLVPVYAFYFLLEKRKIERSWTDYLPVADSEFKDELVFVLRAINDHLIVFFRGQVLVAICDGTLYAIGFLCIGLPYAVLVGGVAMVLTLIPFLGAITTCGTALIIAIVQFGDISHPLLVLVVFAIVQSVEGYVLIPYIIGDRVGLHPVTIIIALMAGTALLGGILGAILAIPLTAALRVVMLRYVWRRQPKQGAPEARVADG